MTADYQADNDYIYPHLLWLWFITTIRCSQECQGCFVLISDFSIEDTNSSCSSFQLTTALRFYCTLIGINGRHSDDLPTFFFILQFISIHLIAQGLFHFAEWRYVWDVGDWNQIYTVHIHRTSWQLLYGNCHYLLVSEDWFNLNSTEVGWGFSVLLRFWNGFCRFPWPQHFDVWTKIIQWELSSFISTLTFVFTQYSLLVFSWWMKHDMQILVDLYSHCCLLRIEDYISKSHIN